MFTMEVLYSIGNRIKNGIIDVQFLGKNRIFANNELNKGENREEMYFNNDNHVNGILGIINEQRETGEFCDITIKVEKSCFPAHRYFLSASCDYFKTLLTGDFMEKDQKIIEIKGICPESMKILLTYLYTGVLTVNLNNVCEILKTANLLQLSWPKLKCVDFLQNILDNENCLEIWKLAVIFESPKLENGSKRVVLQNLDVIMKTKSFLNLSYENVIDLLENRNILITEDIIFLANLNWIKHDLDNRKINMHNLLENIDCRKISHEFLKTTILKEQTLRDNERCLNWVLDNFIETSNKFNNYGKMLIFNDDKLQYFDIINSKCKILTTQSLCKYYSPAIYNNCIYITGGQIFPNCITTKCKFYNIINNKWNEFPFLCNTYGHQACVLNDNLYIIGGRKHGINKVLRFDFRISKLFSTVLNMNYGRYLHSSAVLDQCIYVAGGEHFGSYVERLDPRERKWINLPSLNGGLNSECSGSMTAISNTLYFSNKSTGKIEKFDIRGKSWESIAPLPNLIQENELVNVNNKLFSIYEDGVLLYDHRKDSWNKIFESRFQQPIVIPF